jgi:hypothetical protein
MSTFQTLAQLEAFRTGMAEPLREQCHVHVANEPLVLAYTQMAGEPFSIWGAMIGRRSDRPKFLWVPDPRNRDDQNGLFTELARYLNQHVQAGWKKKEPVQLWVTNTAAANDLARVGRAMRQKKDHPDVQYAGVLLDLYAQSATAPGSGLCVAATQALSEHRATGQSGFENENLAAQLAWWDPIHFKRVLSTTGLNVMPATTFERVRVGEQLAMGNLNTPGTDQRLAPIVAKLGVARRAKEKTSEFERSIETQLRAELHPRWEALWAAHEQLHGLSQAVKSEVRWDSDRRFFGFHLDFLDAGNVHRRFVDSPIRAAKMLSSWETNQTAMLCDVIQDDDLAFLEATVENQAIIGVVERIDETIGRSPHPVVVLECEINELAPGTSVWWRTNPKVEGKITDVRRNVNDSTQTVHIEIVAGMKKNAMPEVGDITGFVAVDRPFFLKPVAPKTLPWTHSSGDEEIERFTLDDHPDAELESALDDDDTAGVPDE